MRKHNHYYKYVGHLEWLDVNSFCRLYNANNSQYVIVKKVIMAGERGSKNYRQDLEEARDSLDRELEMLDEDLRLLDGCHEVRNS